MTKRAFSRNERDAFPQHRQDGSDHSVRLPFGGNFLRWSRWAWSQSLLPRDLPKATFSGKGVQLACAQCSREIARLGPLYNETKTVSEQKTTVTEQN